jgi:hypothetical protein
MIVTYHSASNGIVCAEHMGGPHWFERRTAALLPDRVLSDPLLHYETNADRRMYQALEMLAKLRGGVDQVYHDADYGPGVRRPHLPP